jgi:hypothetical protein
LIVPAADERYSQRREANCLLSKNENKEPAKTTAKIMARCSSSSGPSTRPRQQLRGRLPLQKAKANGFSRFLSLDMKTCDGADRPLEMSGHPNCQQTEFLKVQPPREQLLMDHPAE